MVRFLEEEEQAMTDKQRLDKCLEKSCVTTIDFKRFWLNAGLTHGQHSCQYPQSLDAE